MNSLRLAIRRSGARGGLLATVGAVSLVVTTLVVGITGYLDYSATTSTRAFIAAADPTASAMRVETKLADDPEAQTVAADSLFRHEFSGIPVDVTRTLTDFPLPATLEGAPLSLPGGAPTRITLSADAALEANASISTGRWAGPTAGTGTAEDPFDGVIQADAARQLGLRIGDVLTVGTGSNAKAITVVGTWLANDATDPRWFADPGVATGNAVAAGDGTPSLGPLMVDESILPDFGPTPYVHWTISLEAARASPAQLQEFATAFGNLRQHIIDRGTLGQGEILVQGTVADTAKTVQDRLESVRGVTPVGVLLVALIGLITLMQLARLLSLSRRPEDALLRSRGASAAWLTTCGVAEASVVAVLGSGIGFAVASGVLLGFYGREAALFARWEFAVLAAIAVLTIFGVTAFLDAIRLAKRDAIDDSGRARTAATFGTMFLAVAAAALAVWQSLAYGSPLVTDAAGRSSVNPLAVIAPTLALIALALVFLVIFGPLASAWQSIAAQRPRFQPSYSARQVARRLGGHAVAVLVVTLAVGGLVLASGYSGSWRTLSTSSGELRTGADARIVLSTAEFPQADATPETGGEFASLPGVAEAVPAFTTPISIGDNESGQLTAIPRDKISAVVTTVGGRLDTRALGAALPAFTVRGIEIPSGATSVSLTATVSLRGADLAESSDTTTGTAASTLWFQNSRGAVIAAPSPTVSLDTLAARESGSTTVTVDLDESTGPWWLVGIDYSLSAHSGWVRTDFHDMEAVTASGTQHVALNSKAWGPQVYRTPSWGFNVSDDGLEVGLPGGLPAFVRMMDVNGTSTTGQLSSFDEVRILPMVVSAALAANFDVARSDELSLRFAGSGLTVNGEIKAIAPILPGVQSPNSVFVDMAALEDYILRTSTVVPKANQLWVSTTDSSAILSSLPRGAILVTPETATNTDFALPAERALWIAAIGCLALAVISLGAVALTIARERRGEVAVLRAVGITARQQSRFWFGELAGVLAVSTAFGLLDGLAVSAITVPNLAHSVVPNLPHAFPVFLAFDVLAAGALLLCFLVILLGVAATSASRVKHAALDTSDRLET